MKTLAGLLFMGIIALQYPLWFGPASVGTGWRLEKQLSEQKAKNATEARRNQSLENEVKSLQNGTEAIEEQARSKVNMIKPGETFYQVIGEKK
ncbi:MAG: hypothetical protein RLZZ502_1125 [Pseudomonadota bacterium]|jgi:cell division protein FtsB